MSVVIEPPRGGGEKKGTGFNISPRILGYCWWDWRGEDGLQHYALLVEIESVGESLDNWLKPRQGPPVTELTNENYFSKYRGVIELSSNDVRRSNQVNTILVGVITKALLIQVREWV